MMLGSKGILPPLIPDCFALRALAILGNIHNLSYAGDARLVRQTYPWAISFTRISFSPGMIMSEVSPLVSITLSTVV